MTLPQAQVISSDPLTGKPFLRKGLSVHLVGLCGAGMKALAEFLADWECQISGSDLSLPPELTGSFEQRGWKVYERHQAENLSERVELLIYSPAIPETNPERVAAKQQGIPQYSYTQVLAELMQDRTGVCISGTHGKSTTSAMVGFLLQDAGLEPSIFVGAEFCGQGRNGWAGEGDLMVVESCEYRRHFLDYSPKFAAILNIEPDHFDCYANLEEATAAYGEFARRVAPPGNLVVNAGNQAALTAAASASASVATFSLEPGKTTADWTLQALKEDKRGQQFQVWYQGEMFTELSLGLLGEHNRMNALAATTLAYYSGATAEQIRAGFARFKGIRRRFEERGDIDGITLIDDYAHHPTAVATTLKTARRKFGSRKIWCVYQPHQASRTAALEQDFVNSLAHADEVIIARTFAAREEDAGTRDPSAEKLARSLSRGNVSSQYCGSLDQIVRTLDDAVRPGDVLITMGAGDIDRVQHGFTRRLFRNHAA